MTRLYILLIMLFMPFAFAHMHAQDYMRIHYNNGADTDISIVEIDSITFVDVDSSASVEADLTGSWLWGNQEQGYYELLSFNTDKTYTGYDKYFTYGFDTMTYGTFSLYGSLLTLWSNGFGYQRRYAWFITGLTENALSVITKMGLFTYYRLRPEVLKLKVGEALTNGEDECIFADGFVAQIVDDKLIGLSRGETYILRMAVSTQKIWAYKVMVE